MVSDMLQSFPKIRTGPMVSIGGDPQPIKQGIYLGGIAVSAPLDGKGGVSLSDVRSYDL